MIYISGQCADCSIHYGKWIENEDYEDGHKGGDTTSCNFCQWLSFEKVNPYPPLLIVNSHLMPKLDRWNFKNGNMGWQNANKT